MKPMRDYHKSIIPLIGHIRLKDLVGQQIQQMYNILQNKEQAVMA